MNVIVASTSFFSLMLPGSNPLGVIEIFTDWVEPADCPTAALHTLITAMITKSNLI
jgi:hypothetical protein